MISETLRLCVLAAGFRYLPLRRQDAKKRNSHLYLFLYILPLTPYFTVYLGGILLEERSCSFRYIMISETLRLCVLAAGFRYLPLRRQDAKKRNSHLYLFLYILPLTPYFTVYLGGILLEEQSCSFRYIMISATLRLCVLAAGFRYLPLRRQDAKKRNSHFYLFLYILPLTPYFTVYLGGIYAKTRS